MTDLATLCARLARLQPARIWLTAEDLVALRCACRDVCPAMLHTRHIRLRGVPVTLMRYDGRSRLVLNTGQTVPWASVWDGA